MTAVGMTRGRQAWNSMLLWSLALSCALHAGCEAGGEPITRTADPAATRAAASLRALRPLDAEHAAGFRSLFDESADRDRYVVALSPT